MSTDTSSPRTLPKRLPKVVALDLDATVWMPELYMMTDYRTLKPLRRANGECYAVKDGWDQELGFMEDAQRVIQLVSSWEDTMLAYVSRTTEVEAAALAIDNLHAEFCAKTKTGSTMRDVVDHVEIYPGSKVGHFQELKKALGVEYTDILFLDNESWNTKEVSSVLGVCSVHCPRGLTMNAFERGLELFDEMQAFLERGGSKKEAKLMNHATVR